MDEQEKKDEPRGNPPLEIFTKYSPYMVVDLKNFKDANGQPLSVQPVMSLCRCGESKNKPFCDGTHSDIKFDDSK